MHDNIHARPHTPSLRVKYLYSDKPAQQSLILCNSSVFAMVIKFGLFNLGIPDPV
jgi:hypothetical protein